MTLVIKGETPAKKNQRINTRSGRSFPSKRYTEWHDNAVWQVLSQWHYRTIDFPCRITLSFIHGDLRRRDSDNGTSSILDLLTDCKVIADDNWHIVRELNVKNGYEKGNPSCIIEIDNSHERSIDKNIK